LAAENYDKKTTLSFDRYREMFTDLRNQIFGEHGPSISIPALARQVSLSGSYFQVIYKSLFNTSIGQDMIRSRLEHACTLLRFSSLSISEISEKCHYLNVEHFIRQFKQHMNRTPREYRKE
jgi:AraC-like DNA-binding protein